MRQKHVPTRTCVACRQPRPKRALLRVVRAPDGAVRLDQTGKAHGRGAYLCGTQPCWNRALQRGILPHALKGPVSPEDAATLRAFAESLPATAETDEMVGQ